MYLYLIYLISPVIIRVLLSIVGGGEEKKLFNNSKAYLLIMSFLMFFFMAFRSKTLGSGDSAYYYNQWEQISNTPNIGSVFKSYDMEYGYLTFVFIFSRLFKSGQFAFILSAAVITLSSAIFIKKICKDYTLGFLVMNSLGLYAFLLQGIRQSIALAICLFAVGFCLKRKIIPFLICVAVATLFHGSAIVFLPVYFIFGIKLNWKSIVFIVLVILAGVLLLDKLLGAINYLINDNYGIGDTSLTSGGYVTLFILLFVLIFSLVFKPKESFSNDYKLFSFCFYLSLLCAVFFFMRFSLNTIAERMSFYFIIFVAPLLIMVLQNNVNKYGFYYVIILFFFAFGIYKGLTANLFIPYTFFWQ